MKIISCNCNGIRAFNKKNNIKEFLEKYEPDIICFQELKLPVCYKKHIEQFNDIEYYKTFNVCTEKNGYSGTGTWSKNKPINVRYGYDLSENTIDDKEGRVIVSEFEDFFLVNVYTPNSGQKLERLLYRTNTWDLNFRNMINTLQQKKEVIITGDLNCANDEIDIHSPKTNKRSSGFTDEERFEFKSTLSSCNLIDTFRLINGNKVKYSYWSYRTKARERNKGWRIDYFLSTKSIGKKINNSDILSEELGSDHCPIILEIN